MGNDGPIVLVTGCTGSVGSFTLATIIETRPDWGVIAPVRTSSGSPGEAWSRVTATLDRTAIGGAARAEGRVYAMSGDVTKEGLGLAGPDLQFVLQHTTHVLHIAGDVRFTGSEERARATNVVGTQNVIELADQIGAERLCHVSTAYVAGDAPGRIREDGMSRGRWRNPYEASKAAAEALVMARRGWGRTLIVRPSIVAGCAVDGFTAGWDVFYPMLAALARGDFRVLRAWATGLLDVVSVDYVADAITSLLTDPAARDATVHLTAGHEAITIGEFAEAAAQLLGREAPRILSPAEGTIEEFAAGHRVSDAEAALLKMIEPVYGPYFGVGSVFDNTIARSLLARHGLAPRRLGDYLDRLIAYGVASDWGESSGDNRPLSRSQWRAQSQPWRAV